MRVCLLQPRSSGWAAEQLLEGQHEVNDSAHGPVPPEPTHRRADAQSFRGHILGNTSPAAVSSVKITPAVVPCVLFQHFISLIVNSRRANDLICVILHTRTCADTCAHTQCCHYLFPRMWSVTRRTVNQSHNHCVIVWELRPNTKIISLSTGLLWILLPQIS